MGGCCCCYLSSSREVIESPAFLHYAVSEDNEPSSNRTATVISTGLLVDTNLDTSVPDTYRPPPAPIPYETYGGRLPTSSPNRDGSECKCEVATVPTNTESVEDIDAGGTLETKSRSLESNEEKETNIELGASKETNNEKSDELNKSSKPADPPIEDEDDICPICLEEYDLENPKMATKCEHHFHLACILEWMERSDSCPVCDQEMDLSSVEG